MKKSELKRQYNKYLYSMPSRVKMMTGRYLPDLPNCYRCIDMAEKTIALTTMPINIHRLEHDQYWVARDALYNLLYGEIDVELYRFTQHHQCCPDAEYQAVYTAFREQLYTKYYERTLQAYIALMTEEAKLGCVRVPARYTPLRQNGRCNNHVQDELMRTEVPAPHTNVIEQSAKIFATAWLKGTPCSVISVQLQNPVSTQDYQKVHMLVKQCSTLFNQYFTDLYTKKLERHKRTSIKKECTKWQY